jgi:hypothetical protein
MNELEQRFGGEFPGWTVSSQYSVPVPSASASACACALRHPDGWDLFIWPSRDGRRIWFLGSRNDGVAIMSLSCTVSASRPTAVIVRDVQRRVLGRLGVGVNRDRQSCR